MARASLTEAISVATLASMGLVGTVFGPFWSSERFSAAWRTTISVLVAKGRARVGVAAAATDWPKRIRDLQFLDHDGDPTAA